MSGLLFLSQEDFYIGNGTKGRLLCNSIKGISLVFFTLQNVVIVKVLYLYIKPYPVTSRDVILQWSMFLRILR